MDCPFIRGSTVVAICLYYGIQVFVGDQLTRKNIRGAKKWAAGEVDTVNQLQWACEVPGNNTTYCTYTSNTRTQLVFFPCT